jgi:DNA-directed RNA polymerase subunit RPC12/RpoP
MSNSTYFVQECPTCGRRLQIRVEYLGKQVVCQHCQGRFVASDPSNVRIDDGQAGNALLRRADELLESVDRWKCRSRSTYPR